MATKKVTKKSLEKLRDEKFGTNKFAQEWKSELDQPLTHRSTVTVRNWEDDEDDALAVHPNEKLNRQLEEYYENQINPVENASQVKSWSRHERAGVYDQIARSIIMLCVGFIIGTVLTNL